MKNLVGDGFSVSLPESEKNTYGLPLDHTQAQATILTKWNQCIDVLYTVAHTT